TFDPSDVTINGGAVAVTSIKPSANLQSFEIDFPAQSAEGIYDVTIGPAITDVAGNPLSSAFKTSFTIDTTPPKVLSISPAGQITTIVDHVDVSFSEAIDEPTFFAHLAQAVSISGPTTTINPTGLQKISDTLYRVAFPSQSVVGNYTVTVGPQINDLAGNVM